MNSYRLSYEREWTDGLQKETFQARGDLEARDYVAERVDAALNALMGQVLAINPVKLEKLTERGAVVVPLK